KEKKYSRASGEIGIPVLFAPRIVQRNRAETFSPRNDFFASASFGPGPRIAWILRSRVHDKKFENEPNACLRIGLRVRPLELQTGDSAFGLHTADASGGLRVGEAAGRSI